MATKSTEVQLSLPEPKGKKPVKPLRPDEAPIRDSTSYHVGKADLGDMDLGEPGGKEPRGDDLRLFKSEEPLVRLSSPDLDQPPPGQPSDYITEGDPGHTGSQWHLRLPRRRRRPPVRRR